MRPKADHVTRLDDEVIRCFIHPEGTPSAGKETTTQELRKEIAARWCHGDYTHHRLVAEQKGLLPIALIIACLIDIDHPLLNSARGTCFNSVECALICLQTMNDHTPVAQLLDIHSVHRQPVDRTP